MTETIKRYVFAACKDGRHGDCECWTAGYIDNVLRAAGEQCSCTCHTMRQISQALAGKKRNAPNE